MTPIRFIFYIGLVNGVLFLGLGVGGFVHRLAAKVMSPVQSDNTPQKGPAPEGTEPAIGSPQREGEANW